MFGGRTQGYCYYYYSTLILHPHSVYHICSIEIRKNLGTISILGYFDGIYTMTRFMHDMYMHIIYNI